MLLGNNLMVPLDQSVLYIRPLYVTSTSNPLPQLRYVIAVFNQDVAIEPTLSGALSPGARRQLLWRLDLGFDHDAHGWHHHQGWNGRLVLEAGVGRLHLGPSRAAGRQPRSVPDRRERNGRPVEVGHHRALQVGRCALVESSSVVHSSIRESINSRDVGDLLTVPIMSVPRACGKPHEKCSRVIAKWVWL